MFDQPIIQTRALRKSYGQTEAVKGLDLNVMPGRITGFLGRNGAGKSSTIKMLMGLIAPTSGGGDVLGYRFEDPSANAVMRRKVAYVSEDKRLYDYMTVGQMIRFTSSFYTDWRADVAARLLREYELPSNRKVRQLSKGMRTKLALLLAFARSAELLILDEPGEGLDPVVLEQVLQTMVRHTAEGAAIFFSSHQIADVERIADHVCILEKGRLILDLPTDDLRESCRQIDLSFATAPAARDFQIDGVQNVREDRNQLSIFASRNADRVVDLARERNASSIDVRSIGLREIYLGMVKEN